MKFVFIEGCFVYMLYSNICYCIVLWICLDLLYCIRYLFNYYNKLVIIKIMNL